MKISVLKRKLPRVVVIVMYIAPCVFRSGLSIVKKELNSPMVLKSVSNGAKGHLPEP